MITNWREVCFPYGILKMMVKKKHIFNKQDVVQALLSGSHPQSKKYQGKQVVGEKIVAMDEGEQAAKDCQRLAKRYGQAPRLTFVPKHDSLYVLCLLQNSNINRLG